MFVERLGGAAPLLAYSVGKQMRLDSTRGSFNSGLLLALASVLTGGLYLACSPDRTFEPADGGAAGEAGAAAGGSDTGQGGSAGDGVTNGGTGGSLPEPPLGGAGGSEGGGEAGEGGADQSCKVPRDCTPPHPLLCDRDCVDGTCAFSPSGVAFATGPDTEDHRSAGFDADGTPYVFWGDSQGTPSAILRQRLGDDGAPVGSTKAYLLPPGTEDLLTFDATFDGEKLGVLWNAQVPEDFNIVSQFDVTDADVQSSAPVTLAVSVAATKYPQYAYTQLAWPHAGRWLLAELYGTFPASWRATWIDPASPPVSPPFVDNPSPLWNPPVVSDNGRVPHTAAVIGSALYLSGFRCDWYQIQDCPVALILARYDRDTLEPLDPPELELTVDPVDYDFEAPSLVRAPVLGEVSNKLAVFWTEPPTPTNFSFGKALFNPDGSVAKSRNVEASDLIPKAFVSLGRGRGLLITSKLNASATPPLHRLQAQLVDDELETVGSAFFLDEAREEEPSDVRASLAPDGKRVLVTFRQGRARHRLIHSTLCQ